MLQKHRNKKRNLVLFQNKVKLKKKKVSKSYIYIKKFKKVKIILQNLK